LKYSRSDTLERVQIAYNLGEHRMTYDEHKKVGIREKSSWWSNVVKYTYIFFLIRLRTVLLAWPNVTWRMRMVNILLTRLHSDG